jgi:hypothetical protein
MAERTLKDVLKAISALDANVDRKIDELRTEMKRGFADLDKELTGHADVHRQIEKDIAALKTRPARTPARAPRRPRTP